MQNRFNRLSKNQGKFEYPQTLSLQEFCSVASCFTVSIIQLNYNQKHNEIFLCTFNYATSVSHTNCRIFMQYVIDVNHSIYYINWLNKTKQKQQKKNYGTIEFIQFLTSYMCVLHVNIDKAPDIK